MKKLLLLTTLFFSTLFFSFAQDNHPKIIATASMIADMAQNIVGDKFEVTTIVPIGKDPHTYEPTPSDATMVAHAKVVLKNSLTFEGWLEKLIDNSGTKAKVITVTEGIDVIESVAYANSADPHAWMSASNGLKYVENIKNAIVAFDVANKDYYEANYTAYTKKLKGLDEYIKTQVSTIPADQRILITSHDAFQYFGRRYDIRLESILGTSTDAQAQTSDIVRLNKVIKENNVPAVFIESTVNPKMLQQLANSNDITIGGSLFSDSIGDKDSDAPTYYDMLKYNTDVIVKALSRKKGDAHAGHNHGTEDDHNHEEVTASSSNNFLLYGILGVLFIGGFLFVYRNMNN